MTEVLFIGKKDNLFCDQGEALALEKFPRMTVRRIARGESLGADLENGNWEGDYIFSFLSPSIIPSKLLEKARAAAINFHPGPPAYPGIGCTNFAIYNGEKEFGVTCHHMAPKVDSGAIINVKRFALLETDSVYTLTQRCYKFILEQFREVVSLIATGMPLPVSTETWKRKVFLRSELNALCELTTDMDEAEIRRRVRATTFPNMPGPFVMIGGQKFAVGEGTPKTGIEKFDLI
jgi:methionyl-tRNA formyltransferase